MIPANAATNTTISQKRSSPSRSRPKPPPFPPPPPPPPPPLDEAFTGEPHDPDAPPPPDRPPPPANRTGACGGDVGTSRSIGTLLTTSPTRSLPSSVSCSRDHFQRTQPRRSRTKVAYPAT